MILDTHYYREKVSKLCLLLLIALFHSSCVSDDPIPTTSRFHILPGDIIVSNDIRETIVLLDSNGNYKSTIFDGFAGLFAVYGVAWNHVTNEVLVSTDSNDRIFAFSAIDGEKTMEIASVYLAGSIRGLTVLKNGNILVIESNNFEEFSNSGERLSNIVTGQNTPEQVNALSNGGYLLCSRGTDVIRTYDSSNVQVASSNSGVGATNAYGCDELSNGTIATAWNGGTDTVTIHSSDLSTTVCTYSDLTLVNNPRGITALANGNLLVADYGRHHLVEIDSNCNFIRVIGQGLSNPIHMVEVPDY